VIYLAEENENGVKPVEREPDKKFKLTYKGKTYDIQVFENGSEVPTKLNLDIAIGEDKYPVEVELEKAIEEVKPPAAKAEATPVAKPESKPDAGPAIKPVRTQISSAKSLSAPMPGKILNVYVEEGDNVNAGETVMILEAMKMENELRAPAKGTVTKVLVKEGENVATGDVLVEFG
jgi:biotin carboxyl carrier protein